MFKGFIRGACQGTPSPLPGQRDGLHHQRARAGRDRRRCHRVYRRCGRTNLQFQYQDSSPASLCWQMGELFDSLPQDERREVKDLANGALGYIHGLERRQRRLSEVDQRHREILRAFLAGQVPQAAAAMAENTKSCSCSAGSLPRLSAAETARELVERRWPTPPLGARIQGDALFEVVVSSDGNVCCVTAISGHPLLVVGLASAIGKWRFNPGKSFIGVIATRYSSAGYQLLG